MNTRWIVVAAGTALGVALAGFWLLDRGSSPQTPPGRAPGDAPTLTGATESETPAHTVEVPGQQRSASAERVRAEPAPESARPAGDHDHGTAGAGRPRRLRSSGRRELLTSAHEDREFDVASLEEVGFSNLEAEEIRQRWESAEESVTQRLPPLPEDAPGHRSRSREIEFDVAMREELGDEAYDAGLFATEQSNRIVIAMLKPDGLATQLGLQPGDVIVAYDGEPLFAGWEYFDAMMLDLDTGRDVTLTFSRDGEIFSNVVPEGRIGVILKPLLLSPDGH